MGIDSIINKLIQLDPKKDSLRADLTIRPRRSGIKNFMCWVVYIFTFGLKARNPQLDEATNKIIHIGQSAFATLSTLQRNQLKEGLFNLKKVIKKNGGSKASQINKLLKNLDIGIKSPEIPAAFPVSSRKKPAVGDRVNSISSDDKTRWFNESDFNTYFDFLHSIYDFHSYTKGTISLQRSNDAKKEDILLIDAVKLVEKNPSAWEEKKPLVFPLHINGNHWTLVYIDRKKRVVEYYDSFNNKAPQQLQEVCNFLNQQDPTEKRYTIEEKVTEKLQHDGIQCGPWAAHFTEERLKNSQFVPKMPKEGMAAIRAKILLKNKNIQKPIDETIDKIANLYKIWDFYNSGRQTSENPLLYEDASIEALRYGVNLSKMQVLKDIENNYFLNPITHSLCHFPNGLPAIDAKRAYTREEAEKIINQLQLRESKAVRR